jgi:hypothetical protein
MSSHFVGKWEDLENLEYEYTSSGEKRYNCPYCINIRGRHDTDKKLFVNEELGKGYCFKCNSVVFKNNKFSFDKDEQNIQNIYEESKPNVDLFLEKLDKQELELSWLSSVENGNPEVRDYLFDVRKIKREYVKKYNIFSWKNYTVLCDTIYRKGIYPCSKFLQLRDTAPNCSIRYVTPVGLVKPIAYLNQLETRSFIICEGMFSAIKASEYSKLSSVALLGKILTQLQLRLLMNKLDQFDEIICCPDGGYKKENEELAQKLYENLINKKIYLIELPEEKDPADLSEEEFLEYFNSKVVFDDDYLFNKQINEL